MLETQAKVVRVEAEYAWVELTQEQGCSQCAGKGCGASKMAKTFCSKPRQFQVQNLIGARIGDLVLISSADGVILRGITLVYGIPLLGLVIGALLFLLFAENELQQDIYAALGAALGLLLAILLSKRLSKTSVHSVPLPRITHLVLS